MFDLRQALNVFRLSNIIDIMLATFVRLRIERDAHVVLRHEAFVFYSVHFLWRFNLVISRLSVLISARDAVHRCSDILVPKRNQIY